MTDTAATECGYCEGHGYTHKTVLGHPGIAVECSECDGTGSTPAATAATALVYCSRCEALVPMSEERLFRATQDHELDEHRDGFGKTIYTNLGACHA